MKPTVIRSILEDSENPGNTLSPKWDPSSMEMDPPQMQVQMSKPGKEITKKNALKFLSFFLSSSSSHLHLHFIQWP
ncbi:hypothetical protein L6452_36508 [Arctium lappa]|uniref:Uncharacterized protein n=1 Tax=Arctium lappa TaxID=4217 RepID=A0ACB8Y9B3_ARCLA|nr:hypothetical protein L6452_36508 [Arctium lappa]